MRPNGMKSSQHSAGAWRSRAWCMMIIRIGSLLDAVSLSVNGRIDCHLKHNSIRCKSNVHFDTIVLNSSKTSTWCSNVIITLLLPMGLKRHVRTISTQVNMPRMKSFLWFQSSVAYLLEFEQKCICVVRFETECSRGARISSRVSTISVYLTRVQ